MSMREVMQINSNFHLPLDDLITGRELGFGDGRHGVVVYDGTFPYFRENRYDRYEIHSTYFEIPAGKTLKPPLESGGLVIYSLTDIVINGVIDMKNRGRHEKADNKGTLTQVTVYGRKFNMPLCGGTVQSALSGRGGKISYSGIQNPSGNREGATEYLQGGYSAGGYSPPQYSLGARVSVSNKTTSAGGNEKADELHRHPTGVVILIARGTITIKGKIDCSASPGIAAESGQRGYIDYNLNYIYGGRGGGGAQSPSGGGGITLIAKAIDRAGGVLDVSGKSYTNTTAGTSLDTEAKALTYSGVTATTYGGAGGIGTPSTGYTSQAGAIKEYIYNK